MTEEKAKVRSAGGRPTKYRPEMCIKVIALLSEGMSYTEASARIGITRETWHDWTTRNPEFRAAVDQGTHLSQAWWERHGRENLDNKNFNVGLWLINMKNRFGWRDRIDQVIKSENVVKLDSLDVEKRIKELMNTDSDDE